MKKNISLLLLCFFMLISFSACIKTNIPENADYRVIYKYGGEPIIEAKLNDEEGKIIKNIFSNKILGFDNPASAYREDVAIIINNSRYMLATDGSENIKINGMYFHLSESEYQQIYDIVSKYGVHFPCL